MLHVVICMCVARSTSSWHISGVWVLTAAIWDIAAVRCPLASSWQTRLECMPIADRAGLNWWPHPTPLAVYLCRGRAGVTAREYLASLNKLRFAMLGYGKPMVEACVTSYRRSLGRQCCVSQKYLPWLPAPLRFFLSVKLSSLFLQFLRALRMSFPVFASHPVRRVWTASLFVWNHYGRGSWHVQVD